MLPLGSLFRYNLFMAKSIKVKHKKRGRPATGKDPIFGARLPREMIAAITSWAKEMSISRSEAMRRLVEKALADGVAAKKSNP